MKLRETSNPIGLKFHEVMKEKGLIANYAAVAKAFDVATTSVYDWVDHGRISKERYRQLVEWSGRPLDWWFDIQPAAALPMPIHAVNEQQPVYQFPPHPAWPFSVSLDDYRRLSDSDRGRIDGYITSIVEQHRSQQPEPAATASQGP